MSIIEAFKLAFQSLWGNKLRSILTLIGVVMGVASVIMLPVVDIIEVSERTRLGCSIAIVWAIAPPIDAPTT